MRSRLLWRASYNSIIPYSTIHRFLLNFTICNSISGCGKSLKMSEEDVPSSPKVEDIEFDELKKGLIENGTLILVDVRDPQELTSQGKIPKSVNIPLPEIPDAFRNLSDEDFKSKYGFCKKDTNLVFSCRSGKRAEAAINLVFSGDPSINAFRLYRGSFLDWESKGGPVEKA